MNQEVLLKIRTKAYTLGDVINILRRDTIGVKEILYIKSIIHGLVELNTQLKVNKEDDNGRV